MTIFGIGPFELLIIVVVALVFVGPERLPEMLYQIGQWVAKGRAMVVDLRNQARAELGDDYESIEQISRQIRELNPRRQIEDLSRALLDDTPTKVDLGLDDAPVDTYPRVVPMATPQMSSLIAATLDDELLDAPLNESLAPADAKLLAEMLAHNPNDAAQEAADA